MKLFLALLFIFNVQGKTKSGSLSFQFSEEGKFELINGSGDVSVIQGKKDEIVVNYVMKNPSEDCKVVRLNKSTTLLKLQSEGENCSIDFTINLPPKNSLDIKTGSGDLSIKDIQGEIVLKTGSGDINIFGNNKSFDGKTGSGDLKFKGVTTSLSFKSGSGDLNFEGYSKKFVVRTGSGDMKFKLTELQKNQFDLDANSGSGDVEIYMPKGSTYKKIDFKSGWGEVKNVFAQKDSSNIKINVKTGSGDLKLKRM